MVKTKKHVKIPIQFKGSFLRNVGIIGLNVKYNAEALTTFLVDLNEFFGYIQKSRLFIFDRKSESPKK